MKEMKFLYLSQADVIAAGVTMREIIEAVETGFREKGNGRTEMPPKPGVHSLPDSFIHAMPAYIPTLRAIGMKWVSGYPGNGKKGLPYINGLLILNDPETGLPVSVMDCVWITAKRTGAATAVAARRLARPESKTVGILGAGVQGMSNLEALKECFPLKKVIVHDIHPEQMDRYEAFVRGHWPELEVVKTADPRQAVETADIVVTSGPILKKPHATIEKGWLPPGAFASLVDYDSYWHEGAFREIDKFITDDVPQLEYYRGLGYFQRIPPLYADLGELVVGKKIGRERNEERTMACNLGLAIDDIATAPIVYRRAMEKKIGTWLPL